MKKDVDIALFTNLLNFYVGFSRFLEIAEGSKNPELEALVNKGLGLVRQNTDKMDEGLKQFLTSFSEDLNREVLLERAVDSKSPKSHVLRVSKFLGIVLPRLSMQGGKMREIFSGPFFKIANQAIQALIATNPSEGVFLCSTNQGRGQPSLLIKWLREASTLSQMPITDVEEATADAATAQELGSTLRDISTQIAYRDPNSEEGIKLQEQKADVIQQIEDLSERSIVPELVFQTAVAAATPSQNYPNHRTQMGGKLGLSPEQEDGLLAEGLVTLVAGAGSGKCIRGDSLIQTERGFVEIQSLGNLDPDQDVPLELIIHGMDHPEPTSHLYRNGFSRTIKISTRYGYFLEGTPNHKIFVLRKGEIVWVQLQDLQLGDLACLDQRRGLYFFDQEEDPLTLLTPKLWEGRLSLDDVPSEVLVSEGSKISDYCSNLFKTFGEKTEEGHFLKCNNDKVTRQLQILLLSFGVICKRQGQEITLLSNPTEVPEVQSLSGYDKTKKARYAWFFDPITSLEDSEADTWDFVVPGTHSFSANGFINHNTRVLAGKVAYLITEKQVPSHSIIAVSFSKKSAGELRERILKYGGPSCLDGGDQGIGTTHSFCGKILRDFAPSLKNRTILQNNTMLVSMAIEQVAMRPTMRVGEPVVKGFFDGLFDNIESSDTPAISGQEMAQGEQDAKDNDPIVQAYQVALDAAYGMADWALNTHKSTWARPTMAAIDLLRRKKPQDLTPQERATFNKVTGLDGGRASTLKRVQQDWSRNRLDPMSKLAAAKKRRPKSQFFNQPANEWFNLGMERVKDAKEGVSVEDAQTYISNCKGNLRTPTEEYTEGNPLPAIYGAYEWLKANDPAQEFPIDFDDMLVEAAKLLVGNRRVRESLQRRYQHILVDEAQDLNMAQHVIFGIIAGNIDPSTREIYDDCRTTAQTYGFVGDDFQCVAKGTMISTPSGTIPIENLKVGDKVLSYRNAKVVPQTVNHIVDSSWTKGIEITTECGRKLHMSPNHKIWATDVDTQEGEWCVYLMYRNDLGFRVGITSKGFGNNLFLRARSERAEKMWILNICPTLEEALLQEQTYSLSFSIPTCVFNGESRGINQQRLNTLFSMFGKNGLNLLHEKNLEFDLPHWISCAFGKHGKERRVINFISHCPKTSQVIMEWSDPEIDLLLIKENIHFCTGKNKRIRKCFSSYRKALSFAQRLKNVIPNSMVRERISTSFGNLRLLTASSLFVGEKVPILENGVLKLDKIISIEEKEGDFIDLDVDDASNFFGNGILSHNSIYSFRGARPEQFVTRSDKMGGCFKTIMLDTNYRSGKAIVDAANRLMAHNTGQIPKTCKAFEEKNGMGVINSLPVGTHEQGAAAAVDKIDQMKDEVGYIGADGTPQFGIAVRTNAEAYAFIAECLKREIPFRSKLNFFTDPTTKSMISWLTFVNASDTDRQIINDAVLNAHKNPGFMLGAFFEDRLQSLASGMGRDINYLQVLRQKAQYIYPPENGRMDWRNKNVIAYLDTLESVKGLTGTPIEILHKILDLQGVGTSSKPPKSMKESLVESILKDPVSMERLKEQAGGQEPSEEDIAAEALAPLGVLLDLAVKYQDLSPFLAYIRELQDINKRKHKSDDPGAKDFQEPAVVIDTVHGWKGLECHHLFVPMAGGGGFPSARNDIEDERRLAYVAITRGQESVTIISPSISRAGKPIEPSRFIGEACVHPLGMDENSAALEEDRINKSASAIYDEVLRDESYEDIEDPLEQGWEFL